MSNSQGYQHATWVVVVVCCDDEFGLSIIGCSQCVCLWYITNGDEPGIEVIIRK